VTRDSAEARGCDISPYRLLHQDILIESDLWRGTPEILSASYGFEGIVGVPSGKAHVIAADGAWEDIAAPDPPYRALTSAPTPLNVALTYGHPAFHADAMPIVFSWPVLPSTVSPRNFRITLNTGQVVTPTHASIFPNIEYNERNTVVVFGEFGNRRRPGEPGAMYIVKTEIVDGLMLVGPAGPVSAVGLEKASGHPYVEGGGPTLIGAKLTHLSTAGEGAPRLFSGQLPNDGVTLYGASARYRLRVLTTGGFSPDGVASVLPTDFETFFRLHAADGGATVRLTRTGVDYALTGGRVRILGLAELGRPDVDAAGNVVNPYGLAYLEDHDNYIDIVLDGDEAAVRQITAVEIPAGDGYLPFYNPGGPGNDPTPGVAYTTAGPAHLEPVVLALDDPMTVTHVHPAFLGDPRSCLGELLLRAGESETE
jgi:hypothetical protein